ncbi:hypothetical protein HK102_008574 [Quaeritorhiza haematococci]|nr:hypothetical protein HK102_008574 [Quaeritorhiza haematococci]
MRSAPSPIAQGYPSPTPPKLVAPPRRAVPPPSASGYIGNIAAGSPPPNSPPQYPMSTPPSSPPMLKIQLPPLELQDLDPDTPPTPPPKSASADSEDPILKKWMLDSDTVSQNMKDKKDWEGRLDGMLEEFRELAGGEAHAAILSTGGERIQEKNEGNSQTSTAATLTALSVPSFIGDQSFRKSSANLGRTPSLLSVSSVDLMARYGRMGDFDATPRTSRLPRTPSLLSVSSIDLMARYGRAGKNNNENRLTRGSVLSITPEELIRRYGRNGHPKSRPLPPLPRTPSRESLISLYSVTKGLSAGTSALKVANFWVPGETAEDSDSTTSKVSEQPESDNRQSHTDKTAEEKKERPVSSISLTPSEIIMKFTAALSDSGSSRTSPETEPTSSKPADSDTQSTTSQDIILSTILGTSSSMPVFSSFLLSIFDEVDKSDNTVELRKRVSFNAESLMESYGVSATEAVLAATAAVVAEAEAEVDGERGAKSEEGGSGISDQDEDADGSEPSPALNVLINDVDYMCDDYADDGPSTSEDSQSGVKTDVMRTGTNDDVADPPVGREDKATTTTAGGTDTDDSIDPASTSTLSEELPPLPSFRLGSLGGMLNSSILLAQNFFA